MQENWQPMLCLPTVVWHCPNLCENTYLMACKNNKRLQNRKDYCMYATSALFLPSRSHRIDGRNGPQEVCNPTSHLEQNCLQHQTRSAVALTTQSLITAVEGDVTTSLGDLFQVCATLLVQFFFLMSNLNLISHDMWPSPLPAITKKSGPVIIATPLQILWAGA